MKRDIFPGWSGLLVIFPLTLVQFFWQFLLGEDPELVTIKEVVSYVIASIALLLWGLWVLRRLNSFIGLVFLAILLLGVDYFWSLALIDIYEYTRPAYLIIVRILGSITTSVILIYNLGRLLLLLIERTKTVLRK